MGITHGEEGGEAADSLALGLPRPQKRSITFQTILRWRGGLGGAGRKEQPSLGSEERG